jgi:hypothetical protein
VSACLVGAAAALICAPHSSGDAGFLDMLARHHFSAVAGDQGLITAGHAVCYALDVGQAALQEIDIVEASNPALSWSQANEFVSIAIVELCPAQHADEEAGK